jgi:signal transduction histidine kinase
VDSHGPLHVVMPRIGLARIVRNLLGNALVATPPGGTVRLLARRDGARPGGNGIRGVTQSHVRLEIHDEGPGPGRVGFHRGGGLGLDVVRSLVLPSGGWLVLGRSRFGGACAAVTLPSPAEAVS